jgi:hypothetical protein
MSCLAPRASFNASFLLLLPAPPAALFSSWNFHYTCDIIFLLITSLIKSNSITGSHHLLLLRLLLLLATPLLVDLCILGMTECGHALLLILVGMVALETLALTCIARIAKVARLPIIIEAINIVIVGAEIA